MGWAVEVEEGAGKVEVGLDLQHLNYNEFIFRKLSPSIVLYDLPFDSRRLLATALEFRAKPRGKVVGRHTICPGCVGYDPYELEILAEVDYNLLRAYRPLICYRERAILLKKIQWRRSGQIPCAKWVEGQEVKVGEKAPKNWKAIAKIVEAEPFRDAARVQDWFWRATVEGRYRTEAQLAIAEHIKKAITTLYNDPSADVKWLEP